MGVVRREGRRGAYGGGVELFFELIECEYPLVVVCGEMR